LDAWGISSAAVLLSAKLPSNVQNAATTATYRRRKQAPKSRATAAEGGRRATRTNATLPGSGKETRDHASARAGVRAAATPAREALAPCDILNSRRRVATEHLRQMDQTVASGQILITVQSPFLWEIGFGW
jgi:hypothetical protein